MQASEAASQSADQPAGVRPWSDGRLLTLLLLLAIVLHAWTIGRTAVLARDGIGFIRYALILEQQPWPGALRQLEQHPLYPLCILAVSLPLRAGLGLTPEVMALSCQLVSGLAGVLLVVPMYWLGQELFDRRVGFWSAALFQCLPMCAEITSDGVSDGVYLLLLASALALGVLALQRRSLLCFALTGLASGLAYLTRPEGLLVVGVVLLVLAGVQVRPVLRWPWRRALTGALAVGLGAAVVAGPYMAMIGGLTVKPGPTKLLLNYTPQDTLGQPVPGSSKRDRSIPGVQAALAPATLAVWWMDEGIPGAPPWYWGVKVLARETLHGSRYLAGLAALLGLWWFRDRLRTMPGAWVPLLWCLVLALLLWRVAVGIHYLSERHTLSIVMCGSIPAAAALVRIADLLPGWLERVRRRPLTPAARPLVGLAFLLLVTGWCLPSTLKPLHANRLGHKAAGAWLAANAAPTDAILDPFCWAHFYAGRVFREGEARTALRRLSGGYVVMTQSNNMHHRLMGMDRARALAAGGTPVFHWLPTNWQRKRYRAEEVLVYRVPAQERGLNEP